MENDYSAKLEVIEAVKKLNGKGRWIILQQCKSMLEYETYQEKGLLQDAWTAYFHGVERDGNVIFPIWG